jgi:hypothetical protein
LVSLVAAIGHFRVKHYEAPVNELQLSLPIFIGPFSCNVTGSDGADSFSAGDGGTSIER